MQDWLSKIGGSIKGILIGLILFVISIGVLYWNEGRVDLSNVASNAVEISATSSPTDLKTKFISVTGQLTTNEQLQDDYLKAGDYIALQRNVEVYAWEEKAETKTQTSTNEETNSTSTEKTYTYNKAWISSPADSTKFKFPEKHKNPTKQMQDKRIVSQNAKIGIYNIDPNKAQLPSFNTVTLTTENTVLSEGKLTEDEDNGINYYENFEDIAPTLEGNYIFKGFGTIDKAEIGDIRVSYTSLSANQEVTIFGELNGTKISPYIGEKNSKVYRIFNSTRTESLAQMSGEHKTATWGLRILGFILMWVGLGMLFGPITTILDFIPLVGDLSKSVIGIITFIAAAILSTLIIWISMIMHSIIAIILVIIIVGIIVSTIMKSKTATKTGPGQISKKE